MKNLSKTLCAASAIALLMSGTAMASITYRTIQVCNADSYDLPVVPGGVLAVKGLNGTTEISIPSTGQQCSAKYQYATTGQQGLRFEDYNSINEENIRPSYLRGNVLYAQHVVNHNKKGSQDYMCIISLATKSSYGLFCSNYS